MADHEPDAGQHPSELFRLGLDRLHPVVDIEDLAASIELAQDRVDETSDTSATPVWMGSRSSGGVSMTLMSRIPARAR